MRGFRKPCLRCGELSYENYCEIHRELKAAELRQRLATLPKRTDKSKLYGGDYRKRAKEVKEKSTHCHICHKPATPGDPFEADHIIPGDPNSPLAAAHRSCNRSKGNRSV